MRHCAMVLGYRNVRLSMLATDSVLENPGVDVILVEAAARPEDMQKLKVKYGKRERVILLPQTENRYCAWGMNQGIREALRRGCYDAITVMNNDATVDKGYFDAMDDEFLLDSVGVAMPKTMFGFTDTIYGAGVDTNVFGFPCLRGFGQRDKGQFDKYSETEYTSMVVTTIRIGVFKDIGLLDEDYVMYLDDIDFSIRAKRAGWTVTFNPNAVARHHVLQAVGQTSSKQMGWVRQLTERNLLLLAHKNGYLTPRYALMHLLHCIKISVFNYNEAVPVVKGLLWFWGNRLRGK